MKKFLSSFLVLAMVMSLFVGSVQASVPSFTITLGTPATADLGTQFNLTCTASGMDDTNFGAMWTLRLSYDNTKVAPVITSSKYTFTSAIYGTSAVTHAFPTASGTTGYVGLVLDGADITSTTELISIKFNAIAAGNPDFKVVNASSNVADSNANEFGIIGVNPTMSIVAADQPQTAPLSTLFTATAPTAALNDGSISGTTTAMQYKKLGDASYTVVTGTSITGLVAGDYLISYAARTGYTASPDTTVTVGAYVPPTPKSLAITAAINAITALPTTIALTDETAVISARGLVTAAMNLMATDADITNLSVLTSAEATIVTLKADALIKANAITAAINAITALPTTIALTDETAVEATRALVTDAKSKGAVDADITNLSTLTLAETAITTLKAAALEKANAISAAINAITALPTTIALTDETVVVAARALVADAKSKGAMDSDITNLATLVTAESAISTLKAALTTKLEAIAAVDTAIANLPATITLTDENAVITAKGLVDTAIAAGAVNTDFANLAKLTSAEATIVTLKADAAAKAIAITAAITAIGNLPTTIALTDETAVLAARALVTDAQTKGAMDSDITNLATLVTAESAIATLKASQISASVGSVTANVFPGSSNVRIPVTITNLSNAKNFDFGLSYTNTDLTYVTVEKGDNCTAAPTVDFTTNPSKLGVDGLTTDAGISDTQVVAYIVFNVKSTAAIGDTALTISGVRIGLPETSVSTTTNGKITISAVTDPNLPAVETAVAAYETGDLTTLALVATAEGKKAAAEAAVLTLTIAEKAPFNTRISNRAIAIAAARAALEKAAAEAAATLVVVAYETGDLTTLVEVATAEGKKAAADSAAAGLATGTVKTDLLTRISNRAIAIAAVRTALEKAAAEAAAVLAINSGAFVDADLTAAGITANVIEKTNAYIVAVKAVRKHKAADLTVAEIQQAVTDANTVLAGELGNIDGSITGVLSSDAAMLRQYYINALSLTATEAVKADYNKDGVVDSLDLSAILIKAARNSAE